MKLRKLAIISIILIIGFATVAKAQTGQITEKEIATFKTAFKNQSTAKALTNAVSSNDINKLALNRDNLYKSDTYFSHKVKTNGITDQESSGRCWLFTGLNVLKPKVLAKYNISSFEFSQNYSFFWDQLEKANLFLEGIIETADKPMDDRRVEWLFKNAIGDGGQWTGVVDVISKYGLVPKTVMPESKNSESTRMMSKLIQRKLKENALVLREMHKKGKKMNELRQKKIEMLSETYRMLAISLGEPPTEFVWRYKDKDDNLSEAKKYTPKSFYEEAVGVDLKSYVMLMNDPSREYYKLYEIDYDRHIYEGGNWKYINLPINEIKEFAKASIMDNEAMYFSCDVGKQLNREKGTLDVNNYNYGELFGVNFTMDKKQRIQTFESSSSHGMTLIAVDLDKDGNSVKWLLENSWGASNGFNGHLIMTDKWFDEYMFRVVINKKYISEKNLKILEQKPIFLPPWDPMFSDDE
ncbi:MAG: C1 family peptidase [Saprospiraceae bacterium]|nr:C1 family peptidase [Saprospiraceae bacterium]